MLVNEENIKKDMIQKLNVPADKIKILRARRLSCEVEYENFAGLLDGLVKTLNFRILCTITGLDDGEKLSAIYHIAQENGIVLNLKTSVSKNNPIIRTITNYFPAADVYERELADLLGFKIDGIGEGNRYPLTDNWPKNEFPLRKDWKKVVE
jgi:Ni,Fe-hydrogenase III component G